MTGIKMIRVRNQIARRGRLLWRGARIPPDHCFVARQSSFWIDKLSHEPNEVSIHVHCEGVGILLGRGIDPSKSAWRTVGLRASIFGSSSERLFDMAGYSSYLGFQRAIQRLTTSG